MKCHEEKVESPENNGKGTWLRLGLGKVSEEDPAEIRFRCRSLLGLGESLSEARGSSLVEEMAR